MDAKDEEQNEGRQAQENYTNKKIESTRGSSSTGESKRGSNQTTYIQAKRGVSVSLTEANASRDETLRQWECGTVYHAIVYVV